MTQHTYADEQGGAQQEGPVTPYPEPGGQAKTSGWSGSETSHERAVAEDANGTTASRQQQVVRYVNSHRYAGATVKEVRDHFGWHHGQASSALSVMHKSGDLARLTVTRDRCQVYVGRAFVDGREVSPFRTRGANKDKALTEQERARVLYAQGNVSRGWGCSANEVEGLLNIIERLNGGAVQ